MKKQTLKLISTFLMLFFAISWQVQAQSFITTWQVTSDDLDITIPTTGTGYNYSVDWGDGITENGFTGDATHTYATAGTHTVSISGDFPHIYFNNTGDKDKLSSIEQWGDIEWQSMKSAFKGCKNLVYKATDAPNLLQVLNMNDMFNGATNFNGDLNDWNVSNVGGMENTFRGASNFNGKISNWNVSKVENMSMMFANASSFNQAISSWEVSNVTDMSGMFSDANAFNQPIDNWNVANVTSMFQMFSGAEMFNQPIENWNVAQVETMFGMFSYTDAFNQALNNWDVSNVFDMTSMFENAEAFNQPLDNWDVSNVGFMSSMFAGTHAFNSSLNGWQLGQVAMDWMFNNAKAFNQPLNNWDVSQAYIYEMFKGATAFNASLDEWNLASSGDLSNMFAYATSFNQPLNSWNVSTVTNMRDMFAYCSSFNQSLDDWDVSSVTNMERMFDKCSSFNGAVNDWDVSKVTDMSEMFYGCFAFNQPVNNWNVEKVTTMEEMFYDCTSFNQPLDQWDISQVNNVEDMLDLTAISINNYDATLIAWAALDLKDNLEFGVTGLNYCVGEIARAAIITDDNWSFRFDDKRCNAPFITTWQVTSTDLSITIPTTGTTYSYLVDWGDGNIEAGFTGNATHVYATEGTYSVSISGDFPRIYFNNEGDKDKILSIEQWGEMEWQSMESAFEGCSKLAYQATDIPNLSGVTDMSELFKDATSFNGAIDNWDISTMTTLENTFAGATAFNQSLNTWNVVNVTDMTGLFSGATAFNQALDAWNVANVTEMDQLFSGASTFDQSLSTWNVSKVNNMEEMFLNASAFDQSLATWDMTQVANVADMLKMTNLSTENYDATLMAWSELDLMDNLYFGGQGLTYCGSETARDEIVATDNWVFDEDNKGIDCTPLALEDELEKLGIRIFATNQTVHLSFSQLAPSEIVIYDVTGKVMMQNSYEMESTITIPLTYKGILIVKVLNRNGIAAKRILLH